MSTQDSPVIVHDMVPVWGIASGSPFSLKFRTWLKMAGIPHEVQVLQGPPKSRTGKIPYVTRPDGSVLSDSGVLIDTLTNERGVTLDNHLDQQQVLQAHAVRRMMEEHLYYCVAWERWIPAENWAHVKKAYFGSAPWVIRTLVAPLIRRKVKGYIDGMGVGRMAIEEIHRRGEADMTVLSGLLGNKEYFFGEPSTTDAILYGWFGNLLAFPNETHFQRALRARPNLVAHTERMAARYWAEFLG